MITTTTTTETGIECFLRLLSLSFADRSTGRQIDRWIARRQLEYQHSMRQYKGGRRGKKKKELSVSIVVQTKERKKVKTDLSLSCYLCFCFFSSLDEIERRQIEYICTSENLLYYRYFCCCVRVYFSFKTDTQNKRRRKKK